MGSVTFFNNGSNVECYLCISDAILAEFNREGDDFNDIDVGSNTGVRFNLFLNQSVIFGKETSINRNFVELIFTVMRADGESFAPSDAGNQAWV